jgi:hypothetical protein
MERSELILKRQKKLMGQLLRDFDTNLLPRLPEDVAQRFKAIARQKFKALAEESIEIMELDPETELNGHAIAVKDTHSSDARATAPLGGGRIK